MMKLIRTAFTSHLCAIGVAAALFACTARAAEFKEFVGFIETAGSQYAVLDYVPRSNTVIRAEVAVTSRGANTCVFCSRGSATNARTFTLFALMSNDGWRFDYNNINNQPTKIVPIERRKVTLVASCEGLSIDGADPTKPFAMTSSAPTS